MKRIKILSVLLFAFSLVSCIGTRDVLHADNKDDKVDVKVTSTKKVEYYTSRVKDYSAQNPKDRLYKTEINISTLSTEGEVPYICFDDLPEFIRYKNLLFLLDDVDDYCKLTYKDDKYELYIIPKGKRVNDNYNIDMPIYFDVKNNTVYCEDYGKFDSINEYDWNIGFGNDACSPLGIVRGSSKTKFVGEVKPTLLNLDNWGLKMYEVDKKSYIPLYLAYSLAGGGYDYSQSIFYDGTIIVDRSSYYANLNYGSSYSKYFFSNNNSFICSFYIEELEPYSSMSMTFTRDGNSDTFTAVSEYDVGLFMNIKATFDSNNKTVNFKGNNSTQPNNFVPSNDEYIIDETYKYTEDDSMLTIYGVDPDNGNEYVESYMRKVDSYFNTQKIPEGMKDFSYNYLCFMLDNYYGLKEDLGITSFDKFFKETNARLIDEYNNLSNEDTYYNHYMNIKGIDDYKKVFANIINNFLGDGHTSLANSSALGGFDNYSDHKLISNTVSTRKKNLSPNRSTYATLRNGSPTFKIYDKTAVLQFDKFPVEPVKQEDVNDVKDYIDGLVSDGGSQSEIYTLLIQKGYACYHYVAYAMREIEKDPNIKNVVFDVSINNGGGILNIPHLLAFMTSDPKVHIRDTFSKYITEYHYEVDLNGDGVYGGEGDTYEGKYNFYVLQSECSFSCANLFPGVCKSNNCAKIIGAERSAGGACSLLNGSDALGSQFSISSRNAIMTIEDGKLISNDGGIKADKVLDSSKWYDISQLNSWINSNF